MATAQQTDDEKRRNAQSQATNSNAQAQNANSNAYAQSQNSAAGAQQRNQSAQTQNYPFQNTFQSPSGSMPGQQTPMPWSGLTQNMNTQGQSATPWAQNMNAMSPYAQAAGQANQGTAGSPYGQAVAGMPNWQALAQRFGGGQQLGNASPAFQRPQFGGWGGQGMAGGQQTPWLQQLMQGAAQRIAAARAQGGGQWPGVGAAQQPQQQGFAMPQWGGGMPQWGGRQY